MLNVVYYNTFCYLVSNGVRLRGVELVMEGAGEQPPALSSCPPPPQTLVMEQKSPQDVFTGGLR